MKEYFCHGAKYGETPLWPKRKTILYYKLEYDDLAATSKSLPVYSPTWLRIQNKTNEHAEDILLDKVRRKLNGNCKVKRVVIYLSYSPCKDCADELVSFLKTKRKPKVELSVKIANFYYHSFTSTIAGLCLLINSGVNLSVFSGKKDWIQFYNDVTEKDPENQVISENYTYTRDREQREAVDKAYLERLEMIAPYLNKDESFQPKVVELLPCLFPRSFTPANISHLTSETEACRSELE